MAITVGSVSIDVIPDLTRFNATMRDIGRNLSVKVQVDADTTLARAKIDDLGRDASATVSVKVDDGVARAQLAALAQNRTSTINVNANTAGATAQVAALGDSASGAGGGMSGLLAAALSLAPALIPIGAAAIGAAAGLATLGAAAVGAAGITTMVFSGVGDAMKLLGQEQTQAAAAGAAAGAAAAQHAQAIVAAQRQIQSAQMSLGDAQRAAATQQVQDAQAVVSAQQSLAQANDQVTIAQQALTAAQEAGRRELESFANNAADAVLAQRQAVITLETAQANYTKTMASSTATEIQRQQASLDVAKAQQSLTEANQRATESSKDNTAAQEKGVSGTQAVVSAQKQVTTAQQNQQKATQTLADAQRKAAEDQVKSQESIVRAQQGVAAAMDAMASAQRQSAGSTNAGLEATRAKIAELDPATRNFAEYLRGTWVPLWHDIQGAAAAGMLPGVQAGLEALKPVMPAITGLVKTFASALGDLFEKAGKALASPFWQDFAKFAAGQMVSGIKALGEIIGNLARGFAGLWQAFAPVGDIVIGGLVQLSKRFADFGTNAGSSAGFGKFVEYVKESLPAVGHLVGDLLTFVGHVIEALAPIGLPLIHILDGVVGVLNQIPTHVLTDVALGIMGIVAGMKLMQGIQGIFGFIAGANPAVLAIAAVAGAFFLVYENSKTFRDFISNEVLPTLKTWGDWLLTHVVPALQELWDWITNKLVPVLAGIFMDAWHGIQAAVKTVSDAVNDHRGQLEQLWGAIKDVIKWIVDNVLPLLGPILKGAFKLLGDAIGVVIGIISALVDMWNHMWQAGKDIGHWFSNDFVGFFVGAWTSVKDGVATAIGAIVGAYDWLKTKASEAIGFMVYTVYDNGIRSFVNPIADFFGVHNLLPYISYNVSGIGASASGNAGAGQARAMANGGLVTGPGGPRDDRIPIMGSNGEFMVNAAATAKNLPLLLAINGGAGASGGTHFSLGGLVGDIGRILSDPLGALTNAIAGPADHLGGFGGMGHLMQSGIKAIGGWFTNWVGGLFRSSSSSSGSAGAPIAAPPGGAVERWRSVVDTALAMLHQPLSMDNGVLSLIRSESGGNPNAINLTDSNARAGHPSRGLMQTIPTTFEAYRSRNLPDNIVDPLANVYAGINYALKNYGPAMLMAGGRHSNGHYIGYDSGGLVPPGYHMLYNGTGGNEVIAPQQTFQQVVDRMHSDARGSGGTSAPAVHIERATFNDAADIDLLAQQIAYRQRAGAFS